MICSTRRVPSRLPVRFETNRACLSCKLGRGGPGGAVMVQCVGAGAVQVNKALFVALPTMRIVSF